MPTSTLCCLMALLLCGAPGCVDPSGGLDGGVDGTNGGGRVSCSWGDDATVCGTGRYCNAPACGAGTCAALGAASTQGPEKTPVCGCDGLTYWNASVAASNGASVQSAGACATQIACGGMDVTPCPGAAVCRLQLSSSAQCQSTDATGECWFLPADCGHVTTLNTRHCGDPTCVDECTLTSQHQVWYVDPSCPAP